MNWNFKNLLRENSMKIEISSPIRRRFFHRVLEVFAATIAMGARADGTRPASPTVSKKRTREAVGYRDFPYENRTCGKCMLYVGYGECAIVEGKVSVDGWCNQWTPPTIG
jgi:High potential iron-sulfur protein